MDQVARANNTFSIGLTSVLVEAGTVARVETLRFRISRLKVTVVWSMERKTPTFYLEAVQVQKYSHCIVHRSLLVCSYSGKKYVDVQSKITK